ncbi:MAG: TolC family protein [Ignavibacteria bacterium]|nr:TolC family protein [Ignavibacteria bacterium]
MNTVKINILILSMVFAFSGVFNSAQAQQTMQVTLDQLTDMAMKNSHLLKITRLRISENEEKVKEMQSKYFPQLSASAGYVHMSDVPTIKASKGSLGLLPLGGTIVPLPTSDLTIMQGEHDMSMAGLMVTQPVTQITKIKTGVNFAENEVSIARHESEKAELQIKQAVEKLYFGLLISHKQKEEITLRYELARLKLYDVESALGSGKTLEVNKTGLLATVADEEQNLLKVNNQIEDYYADLRSLTGIESSANLSLSEIPAVTPQIPATVDEYRNSAMSGNKELLIAMDKKSKASNGYTAAWKEYLPDIGIIAAYGYQPKIDYVPKNNFYVGAMMQWNLWDWGSRKNVLNQRELLEQQADENIAHLKEQVNNDVEKAFRKLKHAAELMAVAEKVVQYRKADFEIQNTKQESGMSLKADRLTSKANLAKSETDFLSAQMNYRIALTELKVLMGTY